MTTSDGFHVVGRLEAAERQLAQAIRLFFDRGDEVAIHTLAAAAYQILADLCRLRGIAREIEDSDILEEMGVKRVVIDAMRKPQNFFKHGAGNPDETVRFHPMLSVCYLIYCAQFLYALAQRQTPETIVFRSWFFCKHPERLPEELRAVVVKCLDVVDADDYRFFAESIRRLRADA